MNVPTRRLGMDLVKRGTQSGHGNVEANKAKRTPSEDEVLKRERDAMEGGRVHGVILFRGVTLLSISVSQESCVQDHLVFTRYIEFFVE